MKELKGILLKIVKEPKRKGELRACFKNIDKYLYKEVNFNYLLTVKHEPKF